jgi:hypothetical protein
MVGIGRFPATTRFGTTTPFLGSHLCLDRAGCVIYIPHRLLFVSAGVDLFLLVTIQKNPFLDLFVLLFLCIIMHQSPFMLLQNLKLFGINFILNLCKIFWDNNPFFCS